MKHTHVQHSGQGEKDRQMMLSLINAGRAIEQRLEEALARVGLSLAKYGALMHLVEAGEPLNLSECAKKMACVRSNITQLMDRLEADGRNASGCIARAQRAIVGSRNAPFDVQHFASIGVATAKEVAVSKVRRCDRRDG